MALKLSLAQPVEHNCLGSAREALLGARKLEQVRRTGYEESARAATLLDRVLHRKDQLRYALDLVNDEQVIRLAHERLRIRLRRSKDRSRVQAPHQPWPLVRHC